MAKLAAVVLLSAVAAQAQTQYTKAALGDEILPADLPGAPANVGFRMFGGYVDIGEGKSIYYWLVESQKNPTSDPFVVWTNGGPGCSGLGGFLTEQGPFRPTEGGNLVMNDHAWNKVANMVFIEQPAGVGFSKAPRNITYGDPQSAADNHAFIMGILEKFPHYKTNDLYISSESYGGHYMPTLAQQIVERKQITNFKGVFVGNPLTYLPYRDFGQYGTYAGHNLLPKPMWDKYLSSGCEKDEEKTECQYLQRQMDELTQHMDPYALDFPACNTQLEAGRHERHQFLKTIQKANGKISGYFPASYTPCDGNWAAKYLNRAEVQTAIHADSKHWQDCASIDYNQTDVARSMAPVWQFLMKQGLKLVIYSGDDDSVCATLGSQQFIWDLGVPIKSQWKPWLLNKQTGGFEVRFEGLTFITVHGAGHMVPATRPEQSLYLFDRFLNGSLTN